MRLVTERVSIKNMFLAKLFQKQFDFKIAFWTAAICVQFTMSCAPEGSGILGNPTKLQDLVDQQTLKAPFAYDLAIDTISYNSCISENVQGSNIHGLKMGVSEGFTDPLTGAVSAGLKLRTDFLQYIGKNFKPEYPNTAIKPSQLQKILSLSDYNKNAFIQFAIRQRTDLLAVPDLIDLTAPNIKKYAQVPRDLTVLNKDLYSGLLGYNLTKSVQFTSAGAVLAEGPRVYNISDTADPIVLEASFRLNATSDESFAKPTPVTGSTENFGAAEVYPERVRAAFTSKKNILAVTFGGNENIPDAPSTTPGEVANHINILKRPKLANSQSDDNTKAFGRGYQLTFESPNIALPSWLKTKLTKVTEISLDNGAPVSSTSWSCENFLIMDPNHWDNNRIYNSNWTQKATIVEPSCSPIIGSDLTGSNGVVRQAQIKRIRRHYSAENWNIGLYVPQQLRSTYSLPTRSTLSICISPKNRDCYLPTVAILEDVNRKTEDVGIQYDTNKECYLTKDGGGDTKRELGRCAQFASVCVRSGF